MSKENSFQFRPLSQGLGFHKTTRKTIVEKKKNFQNKKISKPDLQNQTNFREENPGMGFITEHKKPSAERAKQSKTVHQPKVVDEKFVLEKTEFEIPNQDFETFRNFQAPKPEIPNPTPVSRSLKKMLDSLPPSFDFREDKKREQNMTSQPSVYEKPNLTPEKNVRENLSVFDVTLDNSLSKAFPKEEQAKHFYHQMVNPVPRYKEVSSNFASAIIDSFILLGLSSIFVVSLVAITKVDIITMLTTPKLLGHTLFELGVLYTGVTLLYFMLTRGLFGSTLGDWAFDVQLGSEKERNHILYPFQVIFRTLIIMITGIFIIPLVSMSLGKDIAYYFSGLKLYIRQY